MLFPEYSETQNPQPVYKTLLRSPDPPPILVTHLWTFSNLSMFNCLSCDAASFFHAVYKVQMQLYILLTSTIQHHSPWLARHLKFFLIIPNLLLTLFATLWPPSNHDKTQIPLFPLCPNTLPSNLISIPWILHHLTYLVNNYYYYNKYEHSLTVNLVLPWQSYSHHTMTVWQRQSQCLTIL